MISLEFLLRGPCAFRRVGLNGPGLPEIHAKHRVGVRSARVRAFIFIPLPKGSVIPKRLESQFRVLFFIFSTQHVCSQLIKDRDFVRRSLHPLTEPANLPEPLPPTKDGTRTILSSAEDWGGGRAVLRIWGGVHCQVWQGDPWGICPGSFGYLWAAHLPGVAPALVGGGQQRGPGFGWGLRRYGAPVGELGMESLTVMPSNSAGENERPPFSR